ncbi:MAG: MFS transporter [Deltaproteobacteria bacterium]|nr:MFS transporter [Deltaproteobacteria bacterium]
MTDSKPESIWSRAFALLCLAEFLGYAQHAVLQPTFPLYITHLGGSPFIVGLVIASFGVTSVISRPILGYWADRWSVTGVMILGLVAQGASVSLCLIPFAGATMFANGLRGIGWSGMNTGAYTLLAISAPSARRGEASGYFGSAQSAATVLLPAVALWIIDARFGGFHAAFILAMSLVLGGAGAAYVLSREIPPGPRGAQSDSTESWWREIISVFDRSVVLPAALTFLLHLSLPCLTSFIVLYARQIGVGHFGWYYVVIGATSMLARPLLGRVSDKIGCGQSLIIAFSLETIALLIMPTVSNLAGTMVAGALYFIGAAIGGARIMALAIGNAPPERRARALASFSVAFPLSNGAGALVNGFALDLGGFTWMYIMAALMCAAGLLLTAKQWTNLK